MRSIATKFLLAVGLFAAAFSAFLLYCTYSLSGAHADRLAAREAELALEFDLAIRSYVGESVRPLAQQMAGKDEFIPELMSTSFVARSVFEKVRAKFPDLILKFSSDNPRNPANQASPEELEFIEHFNRNPVEKMWAGKLEMNGKLYSVRFSARRMKESCLRCHGEPADAPASLLARYGEERGFHRSVGEVVALDTVAVPMDSVGAALRRQAARQLVAAAVGLLALFGGVALVFRRLVTRRLGRLSHHFARIAENPHSGEIDDVSVGGAHDEIGSLATSFNTLAGKLRDTYASLEDTIAERTVQLEASNEELEQYLAETERFNRLAVGRELRMIELKEEINTLLDELGRESRYQVEARP